MVYTKEQMKKFHSSIRYDSYIHNCLRINKLKRASVTGDNRGTTTDWEGLA